MLTIATLVLAVVMYFHPPDWKFGVPIVLATIFIVVIAAVRAQSHPFLRTIVAFILSGILLTVAVPPIWDSYRKDAIKEQNNKSRAPNSLREAIPAPEPRNLELIDPPPSSRKLNSDGSERAFLRVPPEQILSEFKNHTTEQAYALMKPYIGKWMAVKGTVYDVIKNGADDIVVIPGTNALSVVTNGAYQMHFDLRIRGNASVGVLVKGNSFQAVCRADDIQEVGIAFGRCEMID